MDDTKKLMGKILGEIYRIQVNSNIPCSATQQQVYGLLHGFEEAIESELNSIGFVSNKEVDAVAKTIDPIWTNAQRLEAFTGFYNIEPELHSKGVDRPQAMKILRYFHADGGFEEIIKKMDSNESPSECRKFELSKYDK
jgi:hypothetical protein